MRHWWILLKLLCLIAGVETAIEFASPELRLPGVARNLVNSLLLVLLLAPALYYWIVRESDRCGQVEKCSRLLDTLARLILESSDLKAALDFTLREIRETAGWVYGEAWLPSADDRVLELHSGSHGGAADFQAFFEASKSFKFEKGAGLPGRVWSTAKPVWIPDVTQDDNFPRKQLAERAGLKGGLAIPVLSGRRVTLVLAFYIAKSRPGVDERMVDFISSAAAQLGLLIERRRAEDERQNLARANEMKNRMLGIAAHDLRNPLSIMIGHLALLHEDVAGAAFKEEIAIVQRKCSQMLRLVDGLLDSTLIESRGLALDLQTLDLGGLLRQLCEDERILTEEKSISLELDLPPGLPSVIGDRSRLQQVFENLISNAVKYSPRGKSIRIGASSSEEAVEVSVADEGPGISSEELHLLFQEYGRTSALPTGGERSVGLGLSIAHRLVQAHGGRIRVESKTGVGTTFFVGLPLRRGASAPAVLDLG